VPTAPALGGKPKSTIATLRSALRAAAQRAMRRSGRPAARSARAGRHRLGACRRPAVPTAQPLQPSAPWRPAKTVGLVAPSISGSAISIVVSTGPSPLAEAGPLAQRLELQRMRGDIGHVERGSTSTAAALSL
jgi:hypothetical protein